MLMILGLTLLFATVCITRKDIVVQSAGLLIGLLSLLTFLLYLSAEVSK